MKKKFKLEDYQGQYAMCCKTRGEAKIFQKFLHDSGRTWRSGDSYLGEETANFIWDVASLSEPNPEVLYYFNEGRYAILPCPADDYNALEFSDFDWPDIEELYTVNSFLKSETKQPTHDSVNHPSHYTDGKIEVIDFIEDKKLGFARGNAVKYICRAGKKDPDKEIEDLEKAIWYIQREIKMLGGAE